MTKMENFAGPRKYTPFSQIFLLFLKPVPEKWEASGGLMLGFFS
jgi:hypothetical protein